MGSKGQDGMGREVWIRERGKEEGEERRRGRGKERKREAQMRFKDESGTRKGRKGKSL